MKLSDIITEGEERSIIRDAVVQQLVDTFGESPGLFADNQEELVAKMYSDLEAMDVEDVVDPGMEVGGQPIGNFASGGVLNVIDSNSAIEDALQHINLADLEEAEVGVGRGRAQGSKGTQFKTNKQYRQQELNRTQGGSPRGNQGRQSASPMSRAKQQQLKNKQKRNFQQGATADGKYSQQARQKSATRDYQSASVKLPDGRTYNNSAQGWQEVDKKGNPVPGTQPISPTSAQAKELNKIYQNKGKQPQGFMSKMKDRLTTAMGGQLATKTLADPDANLGKRMGAVAGAGIGRGLGNLIRSKPKLDPVAPDKKAVPNVAKTDLSYLQKQVIGGNEQAAQKFVDELSRMKSQNIDISNYAATLPAMLKRTQMDKQSPAYAELVKVARTMSREAFEHVNKVLEHSGITWKQLGFTVLLSESENDVVLLPTKDLTLYETKILAGV